LSDSGLKASGKVFGGMLGQGSDVAVARLEEGRQHHPVQIVGGNVTTFAPHQALCEDKLTFHDTCVVHRVGRVLGEGGDIAVARAEEGTPLASEEGTTDTI